MSWSRENPRYRRSSTLVRRKKKKGFFHRLSNWLRGRKDSSKTDMAAHNAHHRPEPPIPPQLLEELKIAVPRPKPLEPQPTALPVCPPPEFKTTAAIEPQRGGPLSKVSPTQHSAPKQPQAFQNTAARQEPEETAPDHGYFTSQSLSQEKASNTFIQTSDSHELSELDDVFEANSRQGKMVTEAVPGVDEHTEIVSPEESKVDYPLIESVSTVAPIAVKLDRAEVKTIPAASCQNPNPETGPVKPAALRAERAVDYYRAYRSAKRCKGRVAAALDRSAFLRWGLVVGLVGLLVAGIGFGWSYFARPVPHTAKVARIPTANLPKVPPLAPGFFELYAREKESAIQTETVISQGSGLGQALEAVGLGAPQRSAAIIECLTKEGGINPTSVRAGVTLRAVWADRGRTELSRLEYQPESGVAPLVVMPRADGSFWLYNTASPPMTLSSAREAEVETSLWQAGSAVGLDANVIMNLSDILASDVDFLTDIKKGDTFQVLYSREYRDGQPRGVPTIDMVKLVNKGRAFEYYRYVDHNDQVGYYDPDGRTSQKAFFVSPLQYKRISSGFTMNRLHPIYKVRRPHQGVDYAAPAGTPVSTVSDGTVIFAGWNGGYGRLITVRHDDTYTTMYAHLSRFAPGIVKGVKVKQGDLIGHVGATGAATGPHLDFRLKKNGKFIDPVPELAEQKGRKLESVDYVDLTKAIGLIRQRMIEQLAATRSGA